MRINIRRMAITVTSGLIMTLCAVVVAPAAHAVSCYGDYCSDQDPQASGCSADAYTVASANIYGTDAYVEIRWSPTCQTNWARSPATSLGNIEAVQSTGYTQGYGANNGAYQWSRMIYSPKLCVKAVAWGGWGTTETACV
jgi:hypothetical protein